MVNCHYVSLRPVANDFLLAYINNNNIKNGYGRRMTVPQLLEQLVYDFIESSIHDDLKAKDIHINPQLELAQLILLHSNMTNGDNT